MVFLAQSKRVVSLRACLRWKRSGSQVPEGCCGVLHCLNWCPVTINCCSAAAMWHGKMCVPWGGLLPTRSMRETVVRYAEDGHSRPLLASGLTAN